MFVCISENDNEVISSLTLEVVVLISVSWHITVFYCICIAIPTLHNLLDIYR